MPAKAWKETLRDTLDDIKLYEESAKEKVRKIIYKCKNNKELFKQLKYNRWTNNSYLCRLMRKYKKHGKTTVNNQIILDPGVYGQFTGKNGNTWLKIPSFTRGKPICVPLNSNIKLQGMLRLILKDGIVFVHYTINQKQYQVCGEQVVGVDKGYTEAFADSEGNFYGENFGKLLSKYTDKVNSRGKARNKLKAIAHKLSERLDTNPKMRKKIDHIYKFNLGTKKLHKNNKKQKALIRNTAFQAVHAIVHIAKEVRAEDLTKPIINKEKWKNYNRKMSSWAKGALAEALESVTKARGSCLRLVNCAYTSQMDSNTNFLEGKRVGDKFYHASGFEVKVFVSQKL
ncbi:MAG: transposase [Thiomargarita sp.]|nr:transposase [Thiomargarita sp.]